MARILVIEDNPGNLELMGYLLKAFGHTIRSAENGERGIELVHAERPDLVICDIHLPGVDGYAVVKAIKRDEKPNPIPVIAVTALAMAGDREKGMAAGFDGYIYKPIDPERFVEQLDAFLPVELRVCDARKSAGNKRLNADIPFTAKAALPRRQGR